MTNWVVSRDQGINGIRDGYTLSGSQTSDNVSPVFIGAFANAAMTHSQERSDEFHLVANRIRANAYFPRALKALYALLSVGRFDKSCYD